MRFAEVFKLDRLGALTWAVIGVSLAAVAFSYSQGGEAPEADAPAAELYAQNKQPAPPAKTTAKPGALKPDEAAPAVAPTSPLVAAAGAGAAATDIAARLKQEGAGTCAETIDSLAAASMVGVTQSNTVSTWSNIRPYDKHEVHVMIAQRYGGSAAVPYGATGIVASPNPSGKCDATLIQVVASPLPCSNVGPALAAKGKLVGDLVGLPLIKTGDTQTLLMPTGTNTCVLIGFKSVYAE